jgi:[1-hydroxy-2-(trimethylamino)ethyl]phosphonate dioxygenase
VTEPIALHVQAKRFLCARDPGYHARLSPVSQRSLELQGGPLTASDAQVFASNVHAADALQVRRWDDLGKQPGMATLTLDDCLAIAQGCLQPR